MNFTLTIPPGKTERIEQGAPFFTVVLSAVDVFVKVPGKEEILMSQGSSLRSIEAEMFSWVSIRNPNAVEISIIVYLGNDGYSQSSFALIEPKTKVRAYAGLNSAVLPAGGFIELSGVPQTGEIRRKIVTVSNDDPNNNLKLHDAAGNPFATVFAGFPTVYTISERVFLWNHGSEAIAFSAGEIFWTV